ncbi:MAG: hypothetical protein ABL994_16670, partial [Verrucomicrobiales bacterium]
MKTVYDLRLNKRYIADVQNASLNRPDCGLKITHGLYGSEEWFAHIGSGTLPLIRLRGTITRTYMASMDDWPEFEMREEDGTLSKRTRECNDRDDAKLYRTDYRVELDYVLQEWKNRDSVLGTHSKCVVTIRIGNHIQS